MLKILDSIQAAFSVLSVQLGTIQILSSEVMQEPT